MTLPVRRALRTLGQLIAAGGLTALVSAIADGLTPYVSGVVLAGWTVVVTLVVNSLEQRGTIPTVLPTEPARGGEYPSDTGTGMPLARARRRPE